MLFQPLDPRLGTETSPDRHGVPTGMRLAVSGLYSGREELPTPQPTDSGSRTLLFVMLHGFLETWDYQVSL
jgi:hypothetical protein